MNPQEISNCLSEIHDKIEQVRQDILITSKPLEHYVWFEKMRFHGKSRFPVIISIIMTEDENLLQQYLDDFQAWLHLHDIN